MTAALVTAATGITFTALLLGHRIRGGADRARRDEQEGDAHLWDLRRSRYVHPAHNWRATLVRPGRRATRPPTWPHWDELSPGWPLPHPHLPAAIYDRLACPSVLGYNVRCERHTDQPHTLHAVAVDFDHPLEPALQLWHLPATPHEALAS